MEYPLGSENQHLCPPGTRCPEMGQHVSVVKGAKNKGKIGKRTIADSPPDAQSGSYRMIPKMVGRI